MDISKLGYRGKWGALRLKHERGELQKPEVVDLLRSGEPVTAEAQPMIANIIESNGKELKGGRPRKLPTSTDTATGRMYAESAADMIATVTAWIETPSILDQESDVDARFRAEIETAHRRTRYKNRQRITADAQAKEIVTAFLDVSETSLRNFIKTARR